MLQYNTKHSIIFSIILGSLAMIVTLAGCTDDFINTEEIPDAKVKIKGEVIFKPLVTTKVQTRTEAPEGTKYKGIKSLYVFFFDSKGTLNKDYSGDVNFTPTPSEGSTHEHVTFTKEIQTGEYYIYAVANISDEQKSDLTKVETIEGLKKFKLVWNDDITKDLEMFGVFKLGGAGTTPGNEVFETDELLTITPATKNIHSWVRRAVSKVTVDFDGTNLKEGVTVYIKNAVLKDVASGALLGTNSSVVNVDNAENTDNTDKIICTSSDYSISYGNGEDHSNWPAVTKDQTFSPTIWGNQSVTSFHDDNAKALPCYENMQGEPEGKSKLQDSNGDGIIDSKPKDGVDNGTYLEVEGYYVANRPEYQSEGKIIYRFMLGKDAVKNFDLVRNHHYKITMQFKGYGNDIDWHIVYGEKYLDVTYSEDVNYQGKFFVPSQNYTDTINGGHSFSNQNVITVTSFETDGTNKSWITPEITYTYYSHNDQTGVWDIDNPTTGWLTLTEGSLSDDNTQKAYTFVASMTDPTQKKINDLFPTTHVGSQATPYNLSNKNGESTVENTANCYMVGAPGWYCFPLVYGNAITGETNNATAYSSSHIVNHLNKIITTPYIKDNAGINLSNENVSVKLIWQDAENLVTPGEISYDPSLFGGKGGIKFHINKGQEGNAVIALIDNSASEDEYVLLDRPTYGRSGSTRAIWSWHIWVTRFGFEDFEKDIRILNHEEKAFDVMPVNLGWCAGNNPIRYYKRRKCDITFKVGDHKIIRTIEQYPHFLLPRGDHPYYQWGRKDPFVGSNKLWENKKRWTHDSTPYGESGDYDPPRLYNEPKEFSNNKNRKNTINCLEVLVKNPDKWHNATRQPINPSDYTKGFYSTNESYTDLWSNNGKKTVYDPCPPGYQVSDNTVFTGFTTHGVNAKFPYDWYDVLESNMLLEYYSGSSVNRQVLELYTDTRKIQSITFPVTGYRDYDGHAQVVQYPNTGNPDLMGEGYVWFNMAKDVTNSYHLKFHRNDIQSGGNWNDRGGEGLNLIAPYNEAFYNTDGFGIRPVRNDSPGTSSTP
ncbi:fimbrial protein [Parabacteroides goldsteinii]|uniref:fimbrial protein n=1 Tax=Parabacteroides goldsteinii TaxID=328812 RepID=UPI003AB8D89F